MAGGGASGSGLSDPRGTATSTVHPSAGSLSPRTIVVSVTPGCSVWIDRVSGRSAGPRGNPCPCDAAAAGPPNPDATSATPVNAAEIRPRMSHPDQPATTAPSPNHKGLNQGSPRRHASTATPGIALISPRNAGDPLIG